MPYLSMIFYVFRIICAFRTMIKREKYPNHSTQPHIFVNYNNDTRNDKTSEYA